MADQVKAEPFHQSHGYGFAEAVSCSCMQIFVNREAWLSHLHEMMLRDCREREIAVFNERMRPHGVVSFKPTGFWQRLRFLLKL